MSNIQTLEVPKWGLSMQEGKITQWTIKEGDSFKKGQEICVIETTKIANSLEAPFDGTLRRIIGKNGSVLEVGAIIGVCAGTSVSDQEIEQFIQSLPSNKGNEPQEQKTETKATEPQQAKSSSTPTVTTSKLETPTSTKPIVNDDFFIPSDLQGYQENSNLFATPHAINMAQKHNVNLDKIHGSGPQQRVSINDIQKAVIAAGGQWPDVKNQPAKTPAKSTADDSHILATPLARRMAEEWNINLNDCRASGSRGRVCKEDVEAVYYRNRPVSSPSLPAATQPEPTKLDFTAIPMDGMRKTIAERLQAAKSEIPHFYLTIDVDVSALQELRTDINSKLPSVKISINDMFLKAIASALIAVPEVNVQYDVENQQILQFDQADISVAVAIPNGLITPIVKAANKRALSDISTTMRDLATRAKTGKLSPDEFQGGSFCISNLGMFGIKQFEAIINPPQGAILALGAVEKRAVVRDDVITIRPMVTLSMSCDHRVIDGATGAKFLASLKEFVENPMAFLA
ncbi:2-oxo acid dehydrogenase subunit E2 [Commensalibacter communis]|uniref:2-oxo acid dehydrogenase subunit E2 n=1 Tax=Commensalibacter communis TaxID=2972786 RepID=UPI0022FF96B0|nr:2-oxo acid dehydrogenase subunit E2 [Commensalibacter communis]CAI3949416.1 Pyruvate/2-oxoglutarate dehydrogenase complex [Commensalibacter communis]CAI3949651.1 Pyruvate/2-oxoglutarate dehydrogenase complex [Commensalibacter communis]